MTRSKEVELLIATAECCEFVGEAVHFYDTAKDELAATIRAVIKELDEAKERERVAIASWDEERKRALRESARVTRAVRVARDMLSTFREDDQETVVTEERQEAWKAELAEVVGSEQTT